MINGIIVINKEAGFTSHDVVAKMRGILHEKKIGHTGTLDPDAVGVLPVCIGNATKLCDMFTDKDKEYETVLCLGKTTDTQDISGKVLSETPVFVTPEETEEVIRGFIGDYDQIPPMYSALKVNGKKLYELARQGKEIERKARRVHIDEIEIYSMELPKVLMRVACTKGTYIRTLCADIGESLKVGGVMEALKRTRVGNFSIDEAVTLSELEKIRDEGRLDSIIIPVERFFEDRRELLAKPEYDKALENGNCIFPTQLMDREYLPEGEWVRMKKSDKTFVGIYAYDGKIKGYRPVKMFLN